MLMGALLNKGLIVSGVKDNEKKGAMQPEGATGWELKNGFFRTGRKGKNTKV
jgi:hypothetical protein